MFTTTQCEIKYLATKEFLSLPNMVIEMGLNVRYLGR